MKVEETNLGDEYVVTEKSGPFIRVSNTQSQWVEDGLKFYWRNSSPEKIKDVEEESLGKGQILHGYFNTIAEGRDPEIDEDWAEKPVEDFKKLFSSLKPVTILAEKTLVSTNFGYAGTLDWYGEVEVDGKKQAAIIDFKTGEFHEDSYSVQLALYANLLAENGFKPPEYIAVLRVQRDGKATKIHKINNLSKWFRAGILTFERWKIAHSTQLLWALAPRKTWEARKKTRGEKRKAFDAKCWKPEYAWPWTNNEATKGVLHGME